MNFVDLRLSKDRDEVVLKFKELLDKATIASREIEERGVFPLDVFFELRVSAINLLSRLASRNSIYVRELRHMEPQPRVIKGVLEAARNDYLQGFMGDHRLLISAEVFADLLVQAEVLLDHDYKDAAAVLIRAVLEDGMRKLCQANKIEAEKRDTIQQLNEKLYKKEVYPLLHHKELIAKAEIGNSAAHGRFDQYSKEDVSEFMSFVQRFLDQYLR